MSQKSELLKGEETKNFSEFSQLADFSLIPFSSLLELVTNKSSPTI